MGFKDIAELAIIRFCNNLIANTNYDKCNDNIVAIARVEKNSLKIDEKLNWILKEDRKNNTFIPSNDKKLKQILEKKNIHESNLGTIAVILESPHESEYSVNPPLPAIGKTGKNFNDYFDKVITVDSQALKKTFYQIIFMNVIQYQCSLGIDTDCFRDYLFLNLLSKQYFKSDFIRRLNDYNPDIAICLCTVGNHNNVLIDHKGGITQNYLQLAGFYDFIKYRDVKGREYIQTDLNSIVKDIIIENFNKPLYIGSHPSSWNENTKSIYKNMYI